MKEPKVTILIPAYNHEKYVGEAIQSILDQTFKDFELIIINDGSTDSTEAEILKFKDDRIRYFSQENRGLSGTLNRGIELSRGEYFSFLPSDDISYPNKIDLQVKEFQRGDNHLGVVFSKQVIIDAEGNELSDDPIIDWFNVPYRTKEEIFPFLFEKNFLPAPTVMCRKECFDKVGGFDESLSYCQDYDMWLRILKYYDIQILDEPLLKYRWHGKNLTYNKTERTDFERAVLLLKSIHNLEISDIFPKLKSLKKSESPQSYAASYQALASHVLKSGLFELVPIAYSLMEEAKKLNPSLEIESEMEKLVRQRPHFLDLRDKRLEVLNQQVSELQFELNDLFQFRESIEQRLKIVEGREVELEHQQEALEHQQEELEKRRETLAEQEIQIKGKEDFLKRWETELIIVQEKWDRFVKKPHIKVLRFLYKILKAFWKGLPERIKKPIRTRWKGKIFPSQAETTEISAKSYYRNQTEASVEDHLSVTYPHLSITYPMTENRNPLRLGLIKQPKVSVVLPIHNQSHLVEEAIKSILNQTYPNLELIIVNDGSTDRVNEILPRYGFHDQVVILNQGNQGLPRALTNGFRHATGSFFTWTSADNIMLPNQIETLVDFLLRHPDVDMVYSNVEIIGDDGTPLLHSTYRKHNQHPLGSNQIYLPYEVETLGSIEDNFINASFLFRANVGKAIGEYDPCLLGTEDYDYWLRINSLFTIRHLDSNEILYQYRVHTDSLSEKYGESDIFKNARALIRYHQERESYYNTKFDIIILGSPIQNKRNRYYQLALGFRDQGHQVIWGILNSDRTGEIVRREGMVEVFIGKGSPGIIKESLFKHRQYHKALIILTTPIEGAILESLKGEDIFIDCDLNRKDDVKSPLLEFSDAISSRSQFFLSQLNQTFRNRAHLIKDGLHEEKILKKARDNFYQPIEYPPNPKKTCVYYGPLEREFFNQDLFHEVITEKRDWNFALIGEPKKVNKDFVSELSKPENVYFLGEKLCDSNGNFYQNLSSVSAVWAPIKMPLKPDEKYEEFLEKLIEIASLSGRPLLIPTGPNGPNGPDGLDFHDVPFVFQFKSANDCTNLLDLLMQLEIDKDVFDRWISDHHWKEKAKWFIAIANNKLYYRKTREPIKKDRKILDIPPTIYRPNDGKMNVLIQARSLDKGGLEEVTLNLISHFDYKKINILILCEDKGGHIADRCKDLGIMVKVLGREKEKEYREILKKYSIGVVNPHYATFGMRIVHEMGIPVVPVIHNTYVWFNEEEISEFKECDLYVSKYIAVSTKVAQYTIEKFGIPREKVQVIANGLDVLKHKKMQDKKKGVSRAGLGIDEQDFVFLNVGSFDGRKGHHAILSAMRSMENGNSGIKVLCVGNIADPGYFYNLKEHIRNDGLEGYFVLHDYVEDPSPFYQLADAFVLPSLIEGWSISVMEAMFYGLPLILTDVGGNGEIIRDIENGILIPTSYGDILQVDHRNFGKYCSEEKPGNSEALAKAMKDFYNRREYWKERGDRGKKAIWDRYNIERIAKVYEEVFSGFKEREKL